MGTSLGFLAQPYNEMSPKKSNPIAGAHTQESGSNVSGRTGVFRVAQPGPGIAPKHVNSEGVGGSQAGSRSNVTGTPLHENINQTNHRRIPRSKQLFDTAADHVYLWIDLWKGKFYEIFSCKAHDDSQNLSDIDVIEANKGAHTSPPRNSA